MSQISAEIIADSKNSQGNRITTMKLVLPRIIHAELMTHRLFSRNSASSRAIPFDRMLSKVDNNPFIPIAFQKDHNGMQGSEYFEDKDELDQIIDNWTCAKNSAVEWSADLRNSFWNDNKKVTKQLCNRLLEPFMYHTVLVTSTEWENFFALRCPQYTYKPDPKNPEKVEVFRSKKDFRKKFGVGESYSKFDWLSINKGQSEIHMMELAEAMWDALNESAPKELREGEWHIPFGDQITFENCCEAQPYSNTSQNVKDFCNEVGVKIATARCARISYETLGDAPKIDYKADIKLHDILKDSGHFSPFEHCARVMTKEEYSQFAKFTPRGFDKGWCNNFKGFIQYRYLIEE